MKKRKLMLLLPLTALVLGGCTFQDVKSWVGQNIYFPIRNWIDDMINPVKEAAKLESIELSGSYKTSYKVGEEFDPTGLVVTAKYSDGSKKDVSSKATFSGFSSEEVGSCVVTVTFEGKTVEFACKINRIAWSEEELALSREHLHGVELPFCDVEDAVLSYEESSGQLRMFTAEGGALTAKGEDIPTYAAKFASSDGWIDVSYQYGAYQSAPAGSFFVFERSIETGEGTRRISVQFFGSTDSGYSKNGTFSFFASDPFTYSFPSEEIANEFDYYELEESFEILAVNGAGLYFEFAPGSYNDLYHEAGYDEYLNAAIYIYGLSESDFGEYKHALEEDFWSFTESSGAFVGKKTLVSGNVATMYLFYDADYVKITYYYVPEAPVTWPLEGAAGLVQKFAPGSSTVIPEYPGASSYSVYMSDSYNEIDCYADESSVSEYAQILRDALWTETEEGSNVFISPAQDLKLSLVYTSSYGLEIHVLAYVAPSADWPGSAIASLLGIDVSDVLPQFEGSASSFEVYSETDSMGVKVTVGEGNEAGAVSSYVSTLETALFVADSSKENYFTSPNADFKVEVVGSEAGYIDLKLEVLPKWPTNKIAGLVDNLGEGITDVIPALNGADSYSASYYAEYAKVTIVCYLDDFATVSEDYIADLVDVHHFVYAGNDQYGDPYFNSPNGQFNINVYTNSLYGCVVIDAYAGEFVPPATGIPAEQINEFLLAQNPELVDTVPGYDGIDGSFFFDDSGDYALIELYLVVDDSDTVATYIQNYEAVLVNDAHYVASGEGENGGDLYISPNGEIQIELYDYQGDLCIDINLVE